VQCRALEIDEGRPCEGEKNDELVFVVERHAHDICGREVLRLIFRPKSRGDWAAMAWPKHRTEQIVICIVEKINMSAV